MKEKLSIILDKIVAYEKYSHIAEITEQEKNKCLELVLDDLVLSNLLSDERFADSLLSAARKKGRSRFWISMKLSRSGITKDITKSAFQKELSEFLDQNNELIDDNISTSIEINAAIRFIERRNISDIDRGMRALERQGFDTHTALKACTIKGIIKKA